MIMKYLIITPEVAVMVTLTLNTSYLCSKHVQNNRMYFGNTKESKILLTWYFSITLHVFN